MTFAANRTPLNRGIPRTSTISISSVYKILTNRSHLSCKYGIRLPGASIQSPYKIIRNVGYISKYKIHGNSVGIGSVYKILGCVELGSLYCIRVRCERSGVYNIQTGYYIDSLYSIEYPSVRLSSLYSIPHRTDAIYLGGFELMGAIDEDDGGFSVTPYTRENDDGTMIIIPKAHIGYSNVFEAIALTYTDIQYIRNTLTKGWFTLRVYESEYRNCVVTSFKTHRDQSHDVYFYQIGVAEDTRLSSKHTLKFGNITLSNPILDGVIDANLRVVETPLMGDKVWVDVSTRGNWTIGFSCITKNASGEINMLLNSDYVNKARGLVYDGVTYRSMKLTSLSIGRTFTDVYVGNVKQTFTEYNVRFVQHM